LSTTSNGSPGHRTPPPAGENVGPHVEPPRPPIERRSPARPKFTEGWHKELVAKLAKAQAALPSTATITDRVAIWMVNPNALLRADSCLKVLSAEDWAALNRIQDPSNRRSAIAGRVLLRIGLSQMVKHKIEPSAWRFVRTAHDRPIMAPDLPPINFSISHVDQLVVIAISSTLDIGIDVECLDQNINKNVIAEFCHLDEKHSVGGLPRPQEIREFIRLWTLKEAYTKMTGLGHTLDFKTINFTLDPANLKAAGKDRRQNSPTLFETFFIAYEHALFHVSLAIRHPAAATAGAIELQIVNLENQDGSEAAYAAPLAN
jgi:4'-phosphopantetheinyl transferase